MIGMTLGGWLAAMVLTCAAAAVRRTLASRMEVVARACHELRGPLTAARLGLQLGANTGELSPARLRALDLELGRAALALEDLDGARGRRMLRPHQLDPVDVEQLVLDSVEAWHPAAAARGVSLEATWSGPSAVVWGDRLRLAQTTGNLIANAIEHGGGVVTIRGRGDGDRALIEVTDSGPGLPAPVPELIRRAARARRVSGGRGGARAAGAGGARGAVRHDRGRGLAIASAIAESHGGRLAAAPSERGARLVLELPAARPATAS